MTSNIQRGKALLMEKLRAKPRPKVDEVPPELNEEEITPLPPIQKKKYVPPRF